ncbi:MAG: hypothetical protein RL141_540 [Candidatus Parcubacteria bacterium]|jgi:hypothetical protein
MSSFSSFDPTDRLQTIDFLVAQVPFLPEGARQRMGERIEDVDAGATITPEALQELAYDVGRLTWPLRRALAAYLATPAGCDEEWRQVAAAVSRSTGHILERFRHGTTCQSLDQVLAHDESPTALREEERLEIAHVRPHIFEVMLRAHAQEIAPFVRPAQEQLQKYLKQLEALRALAAETPWIQDPVFTKLAAFEQALYLGGEELDPAVLDAEVAYYREEKALPTEGV